MKGGGTEIERYFTFERNSSSKKKNLDLILKFKTEKRADALGN